MPHSPEQAEFAQKLKTFPGEVPFINEEVMSRYLKDAPEYRGCRYLFWTQIDRKYLIAYRNDRLPSDGEILPIMECLFDDGEIHEVGQTKFSREFSQNAYSEKTVADSIADGMAEVAERDSYSDAFDFDLTDTGKKMRKAAEENGKS